MCGFVALMAFKDGTLLPDIYSQKSIDYKYICKNLYLP